MRERERHVRLALIERERDTCETSLDRERESETRETSLDRAKSVFYFLTTGFIPFHRTFSRYKMLTHGYTGLVLHHFVF